MNHTVVFLPRKIRVSVPDGTTVLQAQIQAGLYPDAPCGGKGTCGKCQVEIEKEVLLACQTFVRKDMVIRLPQQGDMEILTGGTSLNVHADGTHEYVAAFDIGTTTLVGFLLDGKNGKLLRSASAVNPQTQYGADVIARIETALSRKEPVLQFCVLRALRKLLWQMASEQGIRAEEIGLITLVGNTAMHHLLLAIDPSSLVKPPYMPTVSEAMEISAGELLPIHPQGTLRILPNIAGFVGADTVSCMVAADFGNREDLTLMIDIGTNGEMVLGNRHRRIACSTAAGPAFEGARISQGMRGCPGAIDRVWISGDALHYHVIGRSEATGVCGSGLLDLVACLLDQEIIDESGYLEGKQYTLPNSTVTLTQSDVREVQLAKAAIRAGIELMCEALGVKPADIQTVLLAGAFGNYMDPKSACRIGMIPPILLDRITPIGNAAGEGAKLCAISQDAFEYAKDLAANTEFLELATLPEFQDRFVDALEFAEDDL